VCKKGGEVGRVPQSGQRSQKYWGGKLVEDDLEHLFLAGCENWDEKGESHDWGHFMDKVTCLLPTSEAKDQAQVSLT